MIPLPTYEAKTVRVIGLGPSGQAALAALKAAGAHATAWDDDPARREAAEAPVKGPKASLDGVDMVLLCDGGVSQAARAIVPKAKAAGVRVLTDLDLFTDAVLALPMADRPKIVGVTGAAGKSVTATIIARVVDAAGGEACVAGTAGAPVLGLPKPEAHRTFVVELPVGRLAASARFRCDVSVMLGLGTAQGTDGLDAAMRAVMRLFRHHVPGDAAIISVDDGIGLKLCTALQTGDAAKVGRARVIPVSGEAALGHGVFAIQGRAFASQDGRSQPIGDFSRATALAGAHMQQDAAAAIAACLALDVAPPMIVKALHGYKGLEGRFEPVGSRGQVLFVDDSRARCGRSVELSIASCPDVLWIGSGGAEAAKPSLKGLATLRGVHLVGGKGEAEPAIATRHATLEQAVAAAVRDAEVMIGREPSRSPVVLYSPGAAVDPSAFRAIVAGYTEERASKRV
jgi:UDP-N-acetylmuramoylalanine--D-glutamate ligase